MKPQQQTDRHGATEITKWAALKAGLPIIVLELVNVLITCLTIGIVGLALYGLVHGFWLTSAPPQTNPLWWAWFLVSPFGLMWDTHIVIWDTRVSALIVIAAGMIVLIETVREKQGKDTARCTLGAVLLVFLKRVFVRAFARALFIFWWMVIEVSTLYGLFSGFWLTTSPQTTPLWVVWVTRVSALVLMAYGLSAAIRTGRSRVLASADHRVAPKGPPGDG